MSDVLVLGSSGQLASEFRFLANGDSRFSFLPKERFGSFEDELKQTQPNFVINCAAYTAVDKAESEVKQAFEANCNLVRRLVAAQNVLKFHLVHFSTDYVFDGTSSTPYVENHATNPINIYGESKLAGEKEIVSNSPSASILRTSWVYSNYGRNFLKTMLKLSEDRSKLRVVGDQLGCPTWARDLARLVMEKFLTATGSVDLYHYSGGGQTSWAEFAREITILWHRSHIEVESISTAEFPTPAKRPAYSVLSKQKIESNFGFKTADWKTSLEQCRREWSKL